MVWKHSYMPKTPINDTMKYYSSTYEPCTDLEEGWCNLPNKRGLNPSEMMIAAYHMKQVVYAYKGKFNPSLDSDWTGGILPNPEQVVDNCISSKVAPPSPYTGFRNSLLGIAFDKSTPFTFQSGCDTISGSATLPQDCRWSSCRLPSSISSKDRYVQMTVAIYVR